MSERRHVAKEGLTLVPLKNSQVTFVLYCFHVYYGLCMCVPACMNKLSYMSACCTLQLMSGIILLTLPYSLRQVLSIKPIVHRCCLVFLPSSLWSFLVSAFQS